MGVSINVSLLPGSLAGICKLVGEGNSPSRNGNLSDLASLVNLFPLRMMVYLRAYRDASIQYSTVKSNLVFICAGMSPKR